MINWIIITTNRKKFPNNFSTPVTYTDECVVFNLELGLGDRLCFITITHINKKKEEIRKNWNRNGNFVYFSYLTFQFLRMFDCEGGGGGIKSVIVIDFKCGVNGLSYEFSHLGLTFMLKTRWKVASHQLESLRLPMNPHVD